MNNAEKTSVIVSAEMRIKSTPEEIWPLLCPVREYDWIEVWDCEMVHSESGVNELGCVFRTDFPTEGDRETWVTCRYDPHKRIDFVRTNSWRTIHFVICLAPVGQETELTWTQHVVALSDEGRDYVQEKPKAFAAQMAMVKNMLGHYLATGTMIKGEDLGLVQRIETDVHRGKTG